MDYKVLFISGIGCEKCREKIRAALEALEGVTTVSFREKFTEVYLENDVEDAALKMAVEQCGDYTVEKMIENIFCEKIRSERRKRNVLPEFGQISTNCDAYLEKFSHTRIAKN